MMAVPTWLAATAGQAGLAGQVNQFLGTHAITYLYPGTLQASQASAGSTSTATNGLYLAQKFTSGASQTATGYVVIPLATTVTSGALLAPTTVSLCPDATGVPGTALASATVTAEYANAVSGGIATTMALIPLPATGLASASPYWITVAAAGDASHFFTWYQSSQTSGASTSPDGTTWTAQAYGFEFYVYDQAPGGQVYATWQDAGARWTVFTWGSGKLVTIAEYTAGQTATGYSQSFRTCTYAGYQLTGVA